MSCEEWREKELCYLTDGPRIGWTLDLIKKTKDHEPMPRIPKWMGYGCYPKYTGGNSEH